MSADDQAAQALADLENKVEASVAAVRARSAEAKSKLERGMLNLQAHSELSSVAAESVAASDLNWDLEAEASVEAPPIEEAPPLDDFSLAAPEPPLSFKDELDVATDEDGIPLGD